MYRKIIVPLLPFLLATSAFAEEETVSTRLNDTVISTRGFSSTQAQENRNVVVVNNEDIKNKGFSTLDNVLDNSPFINVKAGEKGSDRNIDLRGQGKNSPSAVKVMLDSTPLNILDTSHSQMPLNSVNVATIERIEIIPGSGSVLYGNNAVGGTVNIITKADSLKEYGYIQNLYKSFNTSDTSLGIGRDLTDKLYVNFDYSYLNTKGYRDLDESDTHFVSGGFAYKLTDKQTLSFNTKYSQANGITSNGITKDQMEENRRQAGKFITDYKDTTQDYSLKYDYKFSDNIDFNAKVYYQKAKSDNDSAGTIAISPQSEYYSYLSPMFCKMPNGVNYECDGFMSGYFDEQKIGTNLKSKISYNTGSVVVGYDYLNNKLDRYSLAHLDFLSNPLMQEYDLDATNNLQKDTHSGFVLLDQKVVGSLSFNAGARYELAYYDINKEIRSVTHNAAVPPFIYDKSDSNQAYSAGLTYDFNSTNKMYIAYERGFISPSPVQLLNKEMQPSASGRPTAVYVPNNLKSQTGDNYEIGYKGYAFDTYFTLTSFYSQNNNEIALADANIAHTEWSYRNLDKTRRAGLEAFSEQNLGRVTLSESITYINTRVLEGDYKGQRVANVPNVKAMANAKYEIIDNLNLGARLNYNGRYLENNVEDMYQQSFAPDVFTADMLVDYSPVNKLYVMGGVNNVFNEKYNISQDSFGNYVVAPGTNYYVGLRYEF
ncbi:MAG: TonB-dependent receptor [Alphaproteobacteria bacterium]|jgi:iron complex outermembrane receptor protein|nr:TonB-dependent receptor [Alphaproteobacteria bacterium]